ncbi:MAG: metallophosphoesterase family protein [Intestinibacter bartlettii]|uniref:purple acid phosphatase family protein n=1 Tax=Intestinibacter bartlettii TaxID=261299 RepID=UPI0026ED4B9B|nr:metallophosphoesterase family protein [Intestinibacter bartlettii]MDO5009626.1 metallophosphoesterase family protein [Intestinibacter bartlettii]
MKKGIKYFVSIIIAVMIFSSAINVFAIDDSWTDATQTRQSQMGAWENWCNEWEKIKNSPTQMSLSPGADETQLNFSWYSKSCDIKPNLKISDNPKMKDAKALQVVTAKATEGFNSNKATATNLKPNTRYYYSYTINGKWTEPELYQTKNSKCYTFGFVGDPQIGASWMHMPDNLTDAEIQDRAVRNDSFNWNNTINSMIRRNSNMSFIISAGDQIQSRDKEKPSRLYNKNEIEYAGYLSPLALKSIPIATTIGNHDSWSANYSYHFNVPNQSKFGSTMAGGDYYYRYGNTLFIMLNTNNDNVDEHEKFIESVVKLNKDAKWRIVTIHHDIYGSGQHSSTPSVVKLRYKLIPIFEENDIDVVLSGHDHIYSRSYILKGGRLDKDVMISDKEYKKYVNGYKNNNKEYKKYLESIQDEDAIEGKDLMCVTEPKGILYITADSSSGSKYYDLAQNQQAYIAYRWQGNVPTYSMIDVTDRKFTINTYRVDNNKKVDTTFTIIK